MKFVKFYFIEYFLLTFCFLNRYNKAKNDLLQAEKKVQQLETRNNELNASLHQLRSDMARANEEKKVIYIVSINLHESN